MALTSAQVKGRIKNIASKNNADARILMRIYMMDRFLERMSKSAHKDNFIIKGGILVTSMLGVAMRGTMDIDASMKNISVTADTIEKIISDIVSVELDDGVTFKLKQVDTIMDNMEYPGVRAELDAMMEGMITPIKVDVSTGDVITPAAIEYSYDLLVEKRKIKVLAYNLETVLAEKLQTILVRSIYNTRMRDFYDVFALLNTYGERIDSAVFSRAFDATCQKRSTKGIRDTADETLTLIAANADLKKLWETYRKKYTYASEITYETVIDSVKRLIVILK